MLAGDCVVTAYWRSTVARAWRRPSAAGVAASKLLTPRKTLFDFMRVADIAAGATTEVRFNVTAADLAQADETNGDWVVEPGSFVLRFEDGSFGQRASAVEMTATIKGAKVVLDKFPAANS